MDDNKLNSLFKQINQLTEDLEDHYPELYSYLDENPITLPAYAHPQMDEKTLMDYLNSLQEMLKLRLKRPPNMA